MIFLAILALKLAAIGKLAELVWHLITKAVLALLEK
jgi:hypothetical protein